VLVLVGDRERDLGAVAFADETRDRDRPIASAKSALRATPASRSRVLSLHFCATRGKGTFGQHAGATRVCAAGAALCFTAIVTPAAWTSHELDRIADAEELELAPARADAACVSP
jgi:hypothetical protein